MEHACCNTQKKAQCCVSPPIRMQTTVGGIKIISIKVTAGYIHQNFSTKLGKDQRVEADDVAVFALKTVTAVTCKIIFATVL